MVHSVHRFFNKELSMKGFRTLGVGLALAIVPNALTFLSGVDWTLYVSPNVALALSGLLTVAMRCITTSPVGGK
jgi:hypothetical protein